MQTVWIHCKECISIILVLPTLQNDTAIVTQVAGTEAPKKYTKTESGKELGLNFVLVTKRKKKSLS